MRVVEEIRKIQNEIYNGDDLPPMVLARDLEKLSILLGNLNIEIAQREVAYMKDIEYEISINQTHASATTKAKTKEAYSAYLERKGLEKSVIELIRSVKRRLNLLEEEYRV